MSAERRTVTVSGAGTAWAPPDRAGVSLQAEARADDPGTALSACAAAATAMVAAAVAAGVARRGVQTRGLSVQPEWDHRERPRVLGYTATNELSLRLERPDLLGPVLTAAVAAGGEAARVHGVFLFVDDPTEALRSAREAAFRDAKAKAEQYAARAGADLGPLLSIEERRSDHHRPGLPVASRLAGAPAPVSLHTEVGETALDVHVTAVWELLAPT